MTATREQIWNALFAKLVAATGVVTSSRVLQHWNQVDAAAMPALFLAGTKQKPVSKPMSGLDTRWKLHANIYVYTSVGADQQATPATQLNNIIDAIASVIDPDGVGVQTLGGLVYDVNFVDEIETDDGSLGTNAVAIIPIEVTA